MLNIPPETLTRFAALMEKRTVPSIQRNFYKKWLRYYLDFCAKYRLPDSSSKSLTQFLTKLREKKQTDEQIKQAVHAVSVYYGLLQSSAEKETPLTQPIISQRLTEENKSVTLPLAPSRQGRGNNVSASHQVRENNVSVFRQEKKDTPLNRSTELTTKSPLNRGGTLVLPL